MITTTKQSQRLKKKEWAVYHNTGVHHDAERFSLIDSVLDGEYNNPLKEKEVKEDNPKANLLIRLRNGFKTKLSHHIYRTYLFCWFSLYFAINVIVKLVK